MLRNPPNWAAHPGGGLAPPPAVLPNTSSFSAGMPPSWHTPAPRPRKNKLWLWKYCCRALLVPTAYLTQGELCVLRGLHAGSQPSHQVETSSPPSPITFCLCPHADSSASIENTVFILKGEHQEIDPQACGQKQFLYRRRCWDLPTTNIISYREFLKKKKKQVCVKVLTAYI